MRQRFPSGGVDLVDRERQGLTQALEHLRQIAVRPGNLRPPIHQQDDVRGAVERHPRLAQDLAGNILLVVNDDPASVDDFETAGSVLSQTVNAIARDAGFVTDDGAPLPRNSIKEGRLPYVGPAHDHYRGKSRRHLTLIITRPSAATLPS